jgi:cyclic pyranopterin phosphate synthase
MLCKDTHNRRVSYLRVSVTDRCNLRCVYCMPPQGISWRPHADMLTYEEIERVVRVASGLGISKVRLTGGEPLVREDIEQLVTMLAAIPGIRDLAMTTNGTMLADHAAALAEAGLDRVNVSIDSLVPERYEEITRGGRLKDVLAGMDAAAGAGLEPTKVNTVVIRGTNDDEVEAFARKTFEAGWHVRFIELMPLWSNHVLADDWRSRLVSAAEIRRRLEVALGELEPADGPGGSGPARYYRLPGAAGTVGFITPITDHFCHRCNRLRLTADGRLRPCLLSQLEVDLRGPIRAGAGPGRIGEIILEAVERKPLEHHLAEEPEAQGRTMSEIGG